MAINDSLTTKIQNDWSWITHHILSLAIAGALALGGIYTVESLISKHDDASAAKYQAIFAAQAAQSNAMMQQFQTHETERAQELARLLEQNTQLTKTIEQRNQTVAELVKVDATLSAEQAASKISQQLSAAPGEITASGNDVTLDLPSARGVVSRLDELPVAQANLEDTQKKLTNETQIATDAQKAVMDAKDVIAAKDEQLVDADKACKAQVANVKAQARKRNLKYMLLGGAIIEGIRIYLTHSL